MTKVAAILLVCLHSTMYICITNLISTMKVTQLTTDQKNLLNEIKNSPFWKDLGFELNANNQLFCYDKNVSFMFTGSKLNDLIPRIQKFNFQFYISLRNQKLTLLMYKPT